MGQWGLSGVSEPGRMGEERRETREEREERGERREERGETLQGYLWCRLSNRSSPPQSSQFLHENTIGLAWFLPYNNPTINRRHCTEKMFHPTSKTRQTNLCQAKKCKNWAALFYRAGALSLSGAEDSPMDHVAPHIKNAFIISRKLESSVPAFLPCWAQTANSFLNKIMFYILCL